MKWEIFLPGNVIALVEKLVLGMKLFVVSVVNGLVRRGELTTETHNTDEWAKLEVVSKTFIRAVENFARKIQPHLDDPW